MHYLARIVVRTQDEQQAKDIADNMMLQFSYAHDYYMIASPKKWEIPGGKSVLSGKNNPELLLKELADMKENTKTVLSDLSTRVFNALAYIQTTYKKEHPDEPEPDWKNIATYGSEKFATGFLGYLIKNIGRVLADEFTIDTPYVMIDSEDECVFSGDPIRSIPDPENYMIVYLDCHF